MKLESKECKEALKKYPVKNDLEKLAVEVLTVEDYEVTNIPGIQNMSDKQIDELADIIKEIRSNVGIEEA